MAMSWIHPNRLERAAGQPGSRPPIYWLPVVEEIRKLLISMTDGEAIVVLDLGVSLVCHLASLQYALLEKVL